MRKLLFVLVVIPLTVLLFTACDQITPFTPTPVANTSDIPYIFKNGKLTVLMENSLNSFFIYKGRKMGFEYEILKAFARDKGLELVVKTVPKQNEYIDLLNRYEGDLIACNFVMTKSRKDKVNFSIPYFKTPQVLIQRKKENDQDEFIDDVNDLANHEICILENSVFHERLMHLQHEIGDTILLQLENDYESQEELMELVAEGIVDYTVVSKNLADINLHFYSNLDASVAVSFNQKIGFAARKNNPLLIQELNEWLKKFMRKPVFKTIKSKYFFKSELRQQSKKAILNLKKGIISPYDAEFKKIAKKYHWDWILLSSQAYHESHFNPNAVSFGGAYGILQFIPSTGAKYHVYPDSPVEVQIDAAMRKMKNEYHFWKGIPDTLQRMKFSHASYNAGRGHIIDAQRLALKNHLDPYRWDKNVEEMVLKLSHHQYYRDPVVRNGSFKGTVTYHYVKEIFKRAEDWKLIYK